MLRCQCLTTESAAKAPTQMHWQNCFLTSRHSRIKLVTAMKEKGVKNFAKAGKLENRQTLACRSANKAVKVSSENYLYRHVSADRVVRRLHPCKSVIIVLSCFMVGLFTQSATLSRETPGEPAALAVQV